MTNKYNKSKISKESLIKKLYQLPRETGEKEQYWLDREVLLQVVKHKISSFILFNKPTEDGLFKSSIVFNNKTFVYIGKEKIKNPLLLSIVK